MEAGNACQDAMEAAESRRDQFLPRVQQYRRDARRHAVSFTESVGVLRGIGQDATAVRLDFPFPGGSANESPIFATIRDGQAVSQEQLDSAVSHTLRRGLLLQVAALAGAGEDAAAAQSLFASGPAEIDRLAYLHGLAKTLLDISALFGSAQLNEPKIQKVILDSALSCLEPVLAATDEKAKGEAEKTKSEIDKQASKLKV
jgi:hypothetical protein